MSRVSYLLRALVIVAAALWVYAPVLQGEFIWDDQNFIPDNPFRDDPARLWKIWFAPYLFVEYYPIEATVQLAQWDLLGRETFGYHLTNVVLHIVSALLFWRLLEKIGTPFAWFAALLFAVHPLMVESVAWITELKNTLSLPPLLLAMLVYLDYDRSRRPGALALSLVLFLIAMLCKSSCMMFPFVILLHAWWKRGRINRGDFLGSAGFFLISLVLGAVTVWVSGIWSRPIGVLDVGGPIQRFGAIGWLVVSFVVKFFYPAGLLPIYPAGGISAPHSLALLPWFAIGGFIAVAWRARTGWGRGALFGFGFFLINFAPIGYYILKHYQNMVWTMDHNGYISMLGLFGLVAAGAGQLAEKGTASFGKFVRVSLLIIAAFFAVDAYSYAGLFVNRQTLWTYTLRYFPEALTAHTDLAIYYCAVGQKEEALRHARAAVAAYPESDLAHDMVGGVLQQMGDLPGALAEFDIARQYNPGHVQELDRVASAYAQMGRYTDALNTYNEVLARTPHDAIALGARGEVRRILGDFPGAWADLKSALQLSPNVAPARNSFGVLELARGDYAGAISDLRKAREILPSDPNADYDALWIWIARQKLGEKGIWSLRKDKSENEAADRELADALDHHWNAKPDALVTQHALFLLGRMAGADYHQAHLPHGVNPDAGTKCEVAYYMAALAQSRPTEINDLSYEPYCVMAVDTGKTDFFEYTLALGELGRIKW